MWNKIKNALAVVGGVAVAIFTIVFGFLCDSDRRRISDDNEPLDGCRDKLGEVSDGLKSDAERLGECREILERARKRSETEGN